MSISGMVAWFDSLPLFTQIFFGLFTVLMALPIATLIVFQAIESLRTLARAAAAQRKRDGDGK